MTTMTTRESDDQGDPMADPADAGPALDERVLCPDGNCVGVVEDGRCKLCGAPAAEPGLGGDSRATDSAPDLDLAGSPRSGDNGSDVDDPHRRLCTDGACIGLVDDTGRCKVCGATAT